jgi:hypothetical protein
MQSDKGYDERYMPSIAQTQKCRPCGRDFSVSYFIWQFSLHDMNEPMISLFFFLVWYLTILTTQLKQKKHDQGAKWRTIYLLLIDLNKCDDRVTQVIRDCLWWGGGEEKTRILSRTHTSYVIRHLTWKSIYTQQRSILQYVKGHRSLIYSADDWFCFVFVFFSI